MTIAAMVFDDFELLDLFGPLELFGTMPKYFRINVIGPTADPVRSRQGPRCNPDSTWSETTSSDILLVPGGLGTRTLVSDPQFRGQLRRLGLAAGRVASVCTGSALLAAAGLLDGYRATSNKWAFDWVKQQGPKVDWVRTARWVEDRDRWTSSGVAAGMDMTLALIANLHGTPTAQRIADAVELEWHSDSAWDPFAAIQPAPTSRNIPAGEG